MISNRDKSELLDTLTCIDSFLHVLCVAIYRIWEHVGIIACRRMWTWAGHHYRRGFHYMEKPIIFAFWKECSWHA
jgi:hypothetical protein